MPTTATTTFTTNRLDPYINPEEAMASIIHVPITASLTLAKGTVLGKVTATGKYSAYNDALSTGVEVARLILQYSITTDASSNVTIDGEFGATRLTAPVYTQGDFRSEDLVGMDAAALADLQGRIVTGDLTTGHIHF